MVAVIIRVSTKQFVKLYSRVRQWSRVGFMAKARIAIIKYTYDADISVLKRRLITGL